MYIHRYLSYTYSIHDSVYYSSSKMCIWHSDGSNQVLVAGGTPPYYFHWSTVNRLPYCKIFLLEFIKFISLTLISATPTFLHSKGTVGISIIKKISPCSCFGKNDGSIEIEIVGDQPNTK